MASVKLPAWPKGIAGNVWANELADQSLYVVESELLSFSAAAAQVIFSIPGDSIIWSVGLEVVSAFTDTLGNQQLTVSDTGSNLAVFGIGQLLETGFVLQPTLRRYTNPAGVGSHARAIRWSPPAPGPTAGSARVWIEIKPNRRSLNVVKSNR